MERKDLAKEIYKASHITGEFLLRSGVISNEYFDKYQFESDPVLLQEIAMHMLDIIPDDFEIIAGLEMGGIPLATALSMLTKKPLVMVRKEAKKYGTRKFAEGPEIKGKKLLIIEDVVTSGGQIVISTKDLREAGAIIDTAICVINRESGGPENLAKEDIALRPLFTMTELKEAGE